MPLRPLSIQTHQSPSFGPRKGCIAPDLVIIHYTAMQSCAAALDRLCDPAHEVSAHYLIDQTGTTLQLVDEAHRAWHAGRSYWRGETDINSHSIGIELDYPGSLQNFPPFAQPQMDALETLLTQVLARHAIPVANVLGHSDIAPDRKADPGAKFDWARLGRAGLARATPPFDPRAPDPDGFANALTQIGYDPALSHDHRLNAFRLRWRPGASGPLNEHDMGLACALTPTLASTLVKPLAR